MKTIAPILTVVCLSALVSDPAYTATLVPSEEKIFFAAAPAVTARR